ncbi:MAG: hypothetical protein MUC97_10925 [Bernardetiaceae bacterium]|jgi:hypothetical protein|nr:hypothetical protein [Bernardetiaceae bacterium]
MLPSLRSQLAHRVVRYILLATLGLMTVSVVPACASSKGGKKVKRGKPIPCPIKDC